MNKIEIKAEAIPSPKDYLATMPDSEVLTRDSFVKYIRKYHPKRFGFSKKHTKDLLAFRESNGFNKYPDKLYDLPVFWDQEVTWFAK